MGFEGQILGSPDGETYISGHDAGVIRFWNRETGRLIKRVSIHEDDVDQIVFSPDGLMMATGTIAFSHVATGQLLFATQMHGPGFLASVRPPAIVDRGAFVAGNFNPLTFGPDGNIYTAVGSGVGYNTIQRFDGTTGAFIDTFIKNDNPAHLINGVRDIVFRDNLVYVASSYTNEVLRYDAVSGAFVDVFVSAGAAGGINHPDGMYFGPDYDNDGVAELYVTGWLSHSVVRYHGVTGLPLGSFIGAVSGGLNSPFAMAQRGNELFVTSAGTNQILKYNVNSGAYLGIAASGNGMSYPRGLTFGPDDLMYVSSASNDRIMRFTATVTYVGDYVPAGEGGLDNPRSLRFHGTDLFVIATGNREIMRFGTHSEAVFTISLSQSSSLPVTVTFNTSGNTATANVDFTTSTGTITFEPGVTSKSIQIPILDDSIAESTETFSVILSSPVEATIARGTGVGTIIDNEVPPTKFYVVNDGSPDRTYEYSATGSANENYSIDSGNTQPRCAASNVAGDTVWV